LDGICKTPDLVKRAKELGFKALAQTNHGNVDGAVKFYKECKKNGIKPIVGCEMYVVEKFKKEKGLKRYHALVLAKSYAGLKSMMAALTVANQDQFYYRPCVTLDQLGNLEDVVVSTACTSGLLSHPEYEKVCKWLYKKLGNDFYFETQPYLYWKPQAEIYTRALELHVKSRIPIIVTNDVHYIYKGEHIAHEVALAVGSHRRWDDKDRMRFDVKDLWLRTDKEMYDALVEAKCNPKHAQWMMANTERVVEKCNFDMEKIDVNLPMPSRFAGLKKRAEKLVYELAWIGLKKKGLAGKKDYRARLEHEIGQVCSLGFAAYFLVLTDVIWWCRENGIMVGPGRGSVGGSLLAYCLEITDVDPLEYNLNFERFISPGRIDYPDIDVDFQDDRRDEVISYFRKEYGDKNVLQIKTFNEMHGRQTLRDVARVFNVSNEEVGRAAKAIIKRSGGDAREDYSIEDAFTTFQECKEFAKKYPRVVSVAKSLEGICRQGGVHAAGVVISKTPLYDGERCVVINAKDGVRTINWDKKDIDDWGLMKLDILGLSTLTVLNRAKELIEYNWPGVKIDYDKIRLDDEKVLEQFSRGNTVGVFQFGTAGLGVFCREIGVNSFKDLVDINALWRPGTLKSGMTNEFKEIKNKRKQVTPVSGFYDKITKDTFGIMLYQEQIMQVLYHGAGIGWRTVDTIRKAISKSEGTEKIAGFKKEFMDGCRKLKTMSEDEASAVFDKMVFFGSYGFNKSHAVAYTKIGYWTMWLKVYYPTEFYCSLINYARAEFKSDYVDDARKNGIKVLWPDINKSADIWTIEEPGVLRAGLSSITSISERSGAEILKARKKVNTKGCFSSLDSFLENVARKTVNKRVVKNLGLSGALRSLGIGVLCSRDIDEVLAGNGVLDPKDSKEEVLALVGDVLDFGPSDDPLYKISALVKRIKKKIPISTLRSVLRREIKGDHNFIGRIDKIKYSYRDHVTDKRGGGDLGGAYGNFFDGQNQMMITFDHRCTHGVSDTDVKKKIETAENCWVLIRAKVAPDKRGGVDLKLVAHKILFLEELIGEVNQAFLPAITLGNRCEEESGPFDDEVLECTECKLRQGCTAPVRPSRGLYDAMVVAESPGASEDEKGIGLIGKSGKKIWNELLNRGGIPRTRVHVNNVLKCRPPNNKIPSAIYPKKCSSIWLDKELKMIRPMVVLAAGGVAAEFFIKGAKITELNGKVIWSPKYACWVVYCLHPAATMYDASTNQAFCRAVEVFADMVKKLYK